MKMQMTGQMRLEQRMKLAPKMIQSMEILQLPLLALEERIEAELNSNPVLELNEPGADEDIQVEPASDDEILERDLVVEQDNNKLENFERLANIESDYQEYMDRSGAYRAVRDSGEPDRKLEAMSNTAAKQQSLHDYLGEQWRLVEADEKVKKAGEHIIDYIDDRGYLTVRIEQLHNKDKNDFGLEHLMKALELVQGLEPAGVGARDLKDCLLIQLKQNKKANEFEIRLVNEHIDELLENRIPDIARKMDCSVDAVKKAIVRLSRLDTSPGLQVGRHENHPVNVDIIIEKDDSGEYIVRQVDGRIPALKVNSGYEKMAKDRSTDKDTRQFLKNNIRSAYWLMEAIEQRQRTLMNVSAAIVKYQTEFFDKGKLFLKPLPMSKVAEEIGVHVATVSRAVAGKYALTPQGILPLRGFFSGGVDSQNGDAHSWDAIRAKMQEIIDGEDKAKPLNDDQIRIKLKEAGLGEIARRTVAKYRKLMNIPSGRMRKRF